MMRLLLLLSVLTSLVGASAQEQKEQPRSWSTHWSIQSDLHYDTSSRLEDKFRWSSYITGQLRNKYFEINSRFEDLRRPLPGREAEKGWGIPYLAFTSRYKGLELNIGDIYEQFGSGTLLRTYEDRALGLDNSLRGAGLRWSLGQILTAKVLGGQQRYHFDRGWRLFTPKRGYLLGADIELSANQIWKSLNDKGVTLLFAGSYLLKEEQTEDILRIIEKQRSQRLILPTSVDAWGIRAMLNWGAVNLHVEHAQKSLDPSRNNNYIYHEGSLSMLTLSYINGGSSLFLGVRRSEDFDFRSSRSAEDNTQKINFLQPFVKQQTYTLAALYPYATQATGEWSYQSTFSHRFKKGTTMGGKYGTSISIHAALVHDLKREWVDPKAETDKEYLKGTHGYTSDYFGLGGLLFYDFGVELSKKVSPHYSFNLSYMHQKYNQERLEGHAERGDYISSHIFIYEGKYKLSPKVTLRNELQYLASPNAKGDWAFALLECSIAPHIVLTISDLYNSGTTGEHFYMGAIAGTLGTSRLQLSYGKTREGLNCSGGVCRMMPATEGLFLSFNTNF